MTKLLQIFRVLFFTCCLSAIARGAELASFHVLDVGQGDSILVTSPEGKALLVDAGPSGRVVNQLRELGVSAVDLAVISHHHLDHYGGMDEIIEAFPVRNLLVTDSPHTTLRFRELLRVVQGSDIRVLRPTEEGRQFTLGSVTVHVLPQRIPYKSNENDNCIGLRVEYGNVSLLLTGDSESSERRWWINNIAPEFYRDCTILKLPHHGSSNGLDREFLEAVNPELAVLSVGSRNGYGHPNGRPLALLREANVPLLRTDKLGTITLQSDGESWWRVLSGAVRGPPTLARASTEVVPTRFVETKLVTDPQSVFVTRTGRRYHREGCRYTRSSKRPLSVEEASLNYSPCRVCRPPKAAQ